MIGKLRHRVTLLSAIRQADAGGGAHIVWQSLATVWARVEARTSTADISARQDTHLSRKRVTIRHREDVTHSIRINIDARTYEIRSLRLLEEQGRFIVLDVEEVRS